MFGYEFLSIIFEKSTRNQVTGYEWTSWVRVDLVTSRSGYGLTWDLFFKFSPVSFDETLFTIIVYGLGNKIELKCTLHTSRNPSSITVNRTISWNPQWVTSASNRWRAFLVSMLKRTTTLLCKCMTVLGRGCY